MAVGIPQNTVTKSLMVLGGESLDRPSASFLLPRPLSLSTWARCPQRQQGARLVHKRTVSGVSGKVCGAGKMTFSHWAVSLHRCGLTSSNLSLIPPPRRPKADLMLRVISDQSGH